MAARTQKYYYKKIKGRSAKVKCKMPKRERRPYNPMEIDKVRLAG